jgi:hypothetical protein
MLARKIGEVTRLVLNINSQLAIMGGVAAGLPCIVQFTECLVATGRATTNVIPPRSMTKNGQAKQQDGYGGANGTIHEIIKVEIVQTVRNQSVTTTVVVIPDKQHDNADANRLQVRQCKNLTHSSELAPTLVSTHHQATRPTPQRGHDMPTGSDTRDVHGN